MEELTHASVCRVYYAHQIVLFNGDLFSGLHFLRDGRLESLKSSISGKEQTVRMVGSGDVFGDTACSPAGQFQSPWSRSIP